jgi:hypothetical protein
MQQLKSFRKRGFGNTAMECIQCQNCKQNQSAYFCAMKNDFVIDTSNMTVVEKTRSGWKKGDPGYEQHRRKTKKETEA